MCGACDLMTRYPRICCLLFVTAAMAAMWPGPAFSDHTGPTEIERLDPNMAVADPDGDWLWYDARYLEVEG